NASDRGHASKSALLRQIEWDEYRVWSSRSGPRSKWNVMKPGTSRRCVSRVVQTSSKSACDPGTTLNRFIAINTSLPIPLYMLKSAQQGEASLGPAPGPDSQ